MFALKKTYQLVKIFQFVAEKLTNYERSKVNPAVIFPIELDKEPHIAVPVEYHMESFAGATVRPVSNNISVVDIVDNKTVTIAKLKDLSDSKDIFV